MCSIFLTTQLNQCEMVMVAWEPGELQEMVPSFVVATEQGSIRGTGGQPP